ncbi:glutamine--tRNA ligase/YqeY domain fusion protein [bacterium]|nr:glutamine--tRNA ligase/YqeY domain fusion protein [bacterium]
MSDMTDKSAAPEKKDFIRKIMDEDLEAGRVKTIVTRFPPEPNGMLHIGHSKAIVIDFGTAEERGGYTYLRFDDTNPTTEDTMYVESIQRDVHWLGFDWGDRLRFASDYFDQLYEWAEVLIRDGKAYVDSLNEAEIREHRGTVKQAGERSRYADRSIEENLDLFRRMKAGEFPDGSHTLRARIDMANPNMKMRDPLIYRIRHAHHHRTGDKWCIYPMYDYAHPLSDAIEGITHSLCTLEFENNREVYDWFVENVPCNARPRQYEFARLNISYTVMSKRKLLELIEAGIVDGWDDPRMPTLSAYRRRGYTPTAIRAFVNSIGVSKANSIVDKMQLENAQREELNYTAPRRMAVLEPLKVVLTNYPEGEEEHLEAVNNPERPEDGVRNVPFSRELYIEREDFMEDPPKKFFRLAPGREVRLRYAYFITCEEVVKDANGTITELRCTYDPATRGGDAPDGRKVKATLHWVSAGHAVEAEVRLYDHLFAHPNPLSVKEGEDWKQNLNPTSLVTLKQCKLEPALMEVDQGYRCQFERKGYFYVDQDSKPGALVFNRIVTLRDTWAKIEKQLKHQGKL